jgi:signal transduction histidine kinase
MFIPIPFIAVKVSFRTKLLASHSAVALLISAITLLVVNRVVTTQMEEQVDRRLETQARAVSTWLERSGHPNRLAGRLADVVGARVTFVDEVGLAIGESRSDPDSAPAPDSEGAAEEVAVARQGKTGRATRYSRAEDQRVRYIAVPGPKGRVVRLGVPIGEISDATQQIRGLIVLGALTSALVALLLAGILARALTRRLRATTAMAQRLGRGDWDIRAPEEQADEIGVLSSALVAAASELKLSEQQRRELLSNVAHEIRTPVTSIRGYAETLSRGELDAETQREFLQTIHRNSLRIGQLVTDLMELEALEGGKSQTLDLHSVDIADVVENAVSALRVRAENADATVEIAIPDSMKVHGNADAIERIALNLIENALSHGGKGVAIAISARRAGNVIAVEFSDNGPGVTAEQAARIFERFYRGSPGRSREHGGAGLGLAIARQLAQAMHGTLALTPGERAGMAITLELPTETA